MSKAVPDWVIAPHPLAYLQTVAAMEARASAIRNSHARELIWLLEHPPLYTAGTSAEAADLRDPNRFPVFLSGRGGRHTYHGPGQRVGYVLLDLERRGRDIRSFVSLLESWLVEALALLEIEAATRPGATGVWAETSAGPAKLGAIGVRVRRWVTFHGFSINVAPDLEHFTGIRPCGLDAPVTSLRNLGHPTTMAELDAALARTFPLFLSWLERKRATGPKCKDEAFTPPTNVP